ncbi:hypothetical protein [Fusobacterium sp. SYSU M8D902]|uniref:hypothetical protein n=1 Tax=Fusobacterium sp. SYSU M8D902 TaxID=3159562 RepID=UPI0032E38D70
MSKHSSEAIAQATVKLFNDLEAEISGKKPLKLFPKLYTQYELNKKVNKETTIITYVNFSCSMKIANIDFLIEEGYLK